MCVGRGGCGTCVCVYGVVTWDVCVVCVCVCRVCGV